VTNVIPPMAVNPDPRPGRWLLPLVVLGMVLFTYVFVQSLPGADADSVDLDADGTVTTSTTSTTAAGGETSSTTSTTEVALEPDVAAYLDVLAGLETQLTDFQTTMATINGQWDADPRTITYTDAEAGLIALSGQVTAWSDAVASVAAPPALTDGHTLIAQASELVATAAGAVLSGLQGPEAAPRITALEQFDAAVRTFTAAVDDVETQARAGA
jgi:hypothetical protein